MLKILISGYNGFVGTNLIENLEDRIIYGIDITSSDKVDKHFSWSLMNECIDADCIIHLAGKVHDIENVSTEKDYFDINVGLTQKIFKHFLSSKATKFIFFSSMKAVADTVIGDYLTEEVEPDPKTAYGKSKLEAERFILSELKKWKDNEKSEGRYEDLKKVYILRPCLIYGPGNKGNLNLLFKLQQKGLPWPLGAFNNKRSFCSIQNILFVIQKIIDENIEPGIYQIADDETISTNEIINLIANNLNKQARILNIAPCLVKLFARTGDLLPLPLNTERLKKLTESYIVSNHKLKNALGIKKMPFTFSVCMKKAFDSLKK